MIAHWEQRENHMEEWGAVILEDLAESLPTTAPGISIDDLTVQINEGFYNGTKDFSVFGAEVMANYGNYGVQVTASGVCKNEADYCASFLVTILTAGSDEAHFNFSTREGAIIGEDGFAVFTLMLAQAIEEGLQKVLTL